jgi:Flp pilus assembly protein TadD
MPTFVSKLVTIWRGSTAPSSPISAWKTTRRAERPVGQKRVLPALTVFAVAGAVLAGCQTTGMDEEALTEDELPLLLPGEAQAAEPETIFLVEKALDEERLHDAQVLLERYVFTFPDDPRGKLATAELRLAHGNTGGAMQVFRTLVDEPTVAADARQGFGITLILVGDLEVAYKELSAAVDEDPTLWRAWNAIGAYHDAHDDWPKAEDAYRRALAVQPNEPIILNNLGFSLLMQDKIDEALRPLQEAMRLAPELPQVKTNVRLAYARKGEYRRAVSGSSSDVELAKALNNVGYIALLKGDYTLAEAYFLRAMEADPTFNEVAWRNLNLLKSLRDLGGDEAAQAPAAIN